ncbi:MAG: FtsQ-type POTRA domain-containing protein [Terriglobia bacterium]
MPRRMERNMTAYFQERSPALLGNQRAVDNKSRPSLKQWFVWGLRTFTITLLCLALGSVAFMTMDFLLHSPKFDLAIREIHGLKNVPESQLLTKLRLIEDQNKNLLMLDLDEVRRSLEVIPWIRSAVVRRVFPDKLIVEVTERTPIAFARVDHATFLVDDEGILLEGDSESPREFDFPVIIGLEGSLEPEVLERNHKRVALYQNLIHALDGSGAALSKDLSEVHLQDPGSLAVLLNDDPVLVVLGADQLERKFRRYLAMSRQIKEKCPQVDTVDLRFQDQVIIKQSNHTVSATLLD